MNDLEVIDHLKPSDMSAVVGMVDQLVLTPREYLATKVYSCIYLLYNNDIVVYVGQSVHGPINRVRSHVDSDKVFDSYATLPCPTNKLDMIEAAFIIKYKPRYNQRIPGFVTAGLLLNKFDPSGAAFRTLSKRLYKRLLRENVYWVEMNGLILFHQATGLNFLRNMGE